MSVQANKKLVPFFKDKEKNPNRYKAILSFIGKLLTGLH